MPRLRIDNTEVEVAPEATVLDAAAGTGADIPTLCYLRQTGPQCSCMVCVVKDARSGRMLPACATKAEDGMVVDTRGEDVTALRRQTLLMLLSEHVGDCEAPCTRICPASLDIPRMMRLLAAGDEAGAARVAKQDLCFPATLGRICAAPCEKGCRRGEYDEPLNIRGCHASLGGGMVECAKPTGKKVAVVGGTLAGMSAAFSCLLRGHSCVVYDENPVPCAQLREQYAQQLPADILDVEIESIRRLGAQLMLGNPIQPAAVLSSADAVIVANGDSFPESAKVFRVAEHAMPVRSVANGKAAALDADLFLRGERREHRHGRFNSMLGKLRNEELEAYAVARLIEAPACEAARCLGCDCRNAVSCKLRQYADAYGITGSVKRHMERPVVLSIQPFGPVVFEAGKCIKCGICVALCREACDGGLTFAGRGLDTRLELPPGGRLDDDLAVRCAESCPTGALALGAHEETP